MKVEGEGKYRYWVERKPKQIPIDLSDDWVNKSSQHFQVACAARWFSQRTFSVSPITCCVMQGNRATAVIPKGISKKGNAIDWGQCQTFGEIWASILFQPEMLVCCAFGWLVVSGWKSVDRRYCVPKRGRQTLLSSKVPPFFMTSLQIPMLKWPYAPASATISGCSLRVE